MSDLINRREAIQEQVDDILQYLDEYLHPIVSPEHWSVYSELHDMVSKLPSAQPERKTGQWIFEERKRLVDETDDGAVYRIEKWWSCSECGYAKGYWISKPSSNYCENCGSPMEKEGEG